jgi:hypothetical protein
MYVAQAAASTGLLLLAASTSARSDDACPLGLQLHRLLAALPEAAPAPGCHLRCTCFQAVILRCAAFWRPGVSCRVSAGAWAGNLVDLDTLHGLYAARIMFLVPKRQATPAALASLSPNAPTLRRRVPCPNARSSWSQRQGSKMHNGYRCPQNRCM